jgi:hypothetical protein
VGLNLSAVPQAMRCLPTRRSSRSVPGRRRRRRPPRAAARWGTSPPTSAARRCPWHHEVVVAQDAAELGLDVLDGLGLQVQEGLVVDGELRHALVGELAVLDLHHEALVEPQVAAHVHGQLQQARQEPLRLVGRRRRLGGDGLGGRGSVALGPGGPRGRGRLDRGFGGRPGCGLDGGLDGGSAAGSGAGSAAASPPRRMAAASAGARGRIAFTAERRRLGRRRRAPAEGSASAAFAVVAVRARAATAPAGSRRIALWLSTFVGRGAAKGDAAAQSPASCSAARSRLPSGRRRNMASRSSRTVEEPSLVLGVRRWESHSRRLLTSSCVVLHELALAS